MYFSVKFSFFFLVLADANTTIALNAAKKLASNYKLRELSQVVCGSVDCLQGTQCD